MTKYLIVTTILILVVLNEWHENKEFHNLEEEMREFMYEGDRFTKTDGIILCEAISQNNVEIGLPPLDCECFLTEEDIRNQ